VLTFCRFKKHNFSIEKNNTVVNYTTELTLPFTYAFNNDGSPLKYELICVVFHDGSVEQGVFKTDLKRSDGVWLRMSGIHSQPVSSDTLFLTECVLQVWRRTSK
jgi:ubiquitin C-terminal hydrolase